ncbi:hypothetical protein J437_LFUL012878 [Ladona fulva]|uniref:Uncharacterized protein n=1 Tax=Ladona fulva TaxID=123851 RepID=A0A8K0K1Q4_LADFU|nr:hypothetical protein J437_LFUL012878 [Ladona fulva]
MYLRGAVGAVKNSTAAPISRRFTPRSELATLSTLFRIVLQKNHKSFDRKVGPGTLNLRVKVPSRISITEKASRKGTRPNISEMNISQFSLKTKWEKTNDDGETGSGNNIRDPTPFTVHFPTPPSGVSTLFRRRTESQFPRPTRDCTLCPVLQAIFGPGGPERGGRRGHRSAEEEVQVPLRKKRGLSLPSLFVQRLHRQLPSATREEDVQLHSSSGAQCW